MAQERGSDPIDADEVDAIVQQWAVERPELDTLPMEVFGRIYRIARQMGDRVEESYARFGIGRGEFDVLAALRRAGEPYTLSPSRLSATLMLTSGGMTGRLDKLERAGLVQRVPDPGDRRALRARLTAKGREVVDGAVGAGLAEQAAVLSRLPERQRTELAALLRTLLAAFADL
ncbi:MarR family winged helix-turn-helix transcriptional regulator [Planotetraspora kaengkrachanensis]|uniref:MarR family transcriptional regulator n=1 Tax=Planotetraspora kaengkrachanensis TaxID=575193 RepID=A0A8J3PX71_9ACTN|nr:MarR family transcriptional regulator [Planotetraspora kaengkrachanensis]GIG82548.1 MarR family transcriptional regulator [Planotetraspora kaengkrachanensis]